MARAGLWKREAVKAILRPLVRWSPLPSPKPGFEIILGVPWDLRALLDVNLRFVRGTDRAELNKIRIVFDRTEQPGGREFIAQTKAAFADLPLHLQFHPPIAGRIVRKVDQSKFYAGLNWVMGIAACETKYTILHDFDLYPVAADYFVRIMHTMRDRKLRFAGTEYTPFDGLTRDDAILATWALGIDAQWIRQTWSPMDCFHVVAPVNGRDVDLDAFSYLESITPERALTGQPRESFAHVVNLCSTCLRFGKGEKVKVAWRLHYLWYLQDLSDNATGRIEQVTTQMDRATAPELTVEGKTVDFRGVDPTCGNVLRDDLRRMETALFGDVRAAVKAYIESFARFLERTAAGSPEETASPNRQPAIGNRQ